MADRIRSLLDAGIALSSELSLDALLQRLTETAAELTGARYAALGVIDPNRAELETFVTTGLDPESIAAIGDLPRGRGILGVLIQEAQPLRLHNIAADPRSVGFPPEHPEMHTFLGVPILLRGVAYGNLYLTEKQGGGDFTTEDKELVTLLASQAAVAIENARLFESAKRWSDRLESLIEVGNALATEDELPKMLDLVARRLREIVHARFVVVLLRTDGDLRLEAAAGEVAVPVGTSASLSGTKAARVLERGRSERVDSVIEDPESDLGLTRDLGMLTALFVPLRLRTELIGLIVAGDKLVPDLRFSSEDLRLAETFGSRAAVAADQARRVQRDALRRVVQAQEEERRRLARELHDETGQALASILLGLKILEEAGDLAELRERVAALRLRVVETLQDVRRLAVELRPAALDDFGLGPALERLATGFAEQTGLKVELEARLGDDRLPRRGRDRSLPHRSGGVDEHRQARECRPCEHRPHAASRLGRGDRGGRWTGLRLRARHGRRYRAHRDAGTCCAPRRGIEYRVRGREGHNPGRRGSAPLSIRVLIVDDHAVVRAGLRLLLDAEEDIETVGEAGDAREAIFEARSTTPDVVLMDVVLGGQSGIEVTPELLHEQPQAKVLILSMQDDPHYVREAFAAGACGYVLKEAADAELVSAVREVARGGSYVHPALGARMVAAEAAAEQAADEDPLSDREREVLRLLALGHTNQEIAQMLYISVRTAETHRAHIMRKLGLDTRAELVRYALAQGLLNEPEA